MAVSKLPYIQIQLVYIGFFLPKVHKSRVCVPPHFLAPCYATVCIVNPDIQTTHRCSHTSIHTWIKKLYHSLKSLVEKQQKTCMQ